MINEKNKCLTVSWLSGLLSAEIFISTGEWGVQMPTLTAENSHFLWSGSQEAALVMRQAITWINADLIHSAPLGGDELTHWGRVTHICVGKLTSIGSDNGLSPGRRQAIIWTNAGILLIGPLGTNFSEILIGIQTFSFKKTHLKMASAKWRPFVSASMS